MKKRIAALALAFIMVLGTVAAAARTERMISVLPMTMTVNGLAVTPLKSDGSPAEIFACNGVTYVPLRYLSELLGIRVEWDENSPATAGLVGENLKIPTDGPKDGTFIGEGQGFGGTVIVAISVTGGKITNCTVVGGRETPSIGGAALAALADQIKSKGAVDGVSGATLTSDGVRAAFAAALRSAR